MAESDVKIKASLNEIRKEFEISPSKYYYIKYFNSKENYKGDDDEKIVFDVHLRHNEIGKRSIERKNPYTLETLEKTMEKYVILHEKELAKERMKKYIVLSESEIIDKKTWEKAQKKLSTIANLKNENYLYEPVVDNKYYTSETEYLDIVKKADNGYKVKDQQNNIYYILTYGWQGYYYKDFDAFKDDKEVCYIPEYAYEEDGESCVLVPLNKENKSIYYRKDILNAVREEFNSEVYADFFADKAPEKLIEHISKCVLEIVDWQHPESFIYETGWDDEIKDYFSKNEDDKNKYASSKLIEELDNEGFEYE